LLDVYDVLGRSVVGLQKSHIDELYKFGCVTGVWQNKGSILSLTEIYEKPDANYARQHLQVDGLEEDQFLTVFGMYVLSPKIFDYLEENINHNLRERGEFQLTSCLDRIRKEDSFFGYVVKGRRFDIGAPEVYRQTVIDFRNA
jgi:UTP--glucose-1-phosphate uridylyltransferase